MDTVVYVQEACLLLVYSLIKITLRVIKSSLFVIYINFRIFILLCRPGLKLNNFLEVVKRFNYLVILYKTNLYLSDLPFLPTEAIIR